MTKILIMTALELEFKAVKSYLKDVKPVRHPDTGSTYEEGLYESNGSKFSILLVESGAGNVRAADETGRAIQFFKPQYVFFVGVAGGIKDVKLGDVVASTKVIGYEMGKDDLMYKPRLDSVPSSYILEQIAKQVKRDAKWVLNNKDENDYKAFVSPIAAGEKVVASNRSVTYGYLKQYCSDAVAVDMEGNGFLIASRPYGVHAIEVRGISDLIDNKEEADASGSQPVAATNAAAFAFSMIDQLETDHLYMRDTNDLKIRKKLVEELVKLYPQGPEQDDIWKRAGGDVSILINSTSRKSQWFNAIEKLYLGGGGTHITVKSLIDEIKVDYPQFVSAVFEEE